MFAKLFLGVMNTPNYVLKLKANVCLVKNGLKAECQLWGVLQELPWQLLNTFSYLTQSVPQNESLIPYGFTDTTLIVQTFLLLSWKTGNSFKLN